MGVLAGKRVVLGVCGGIAAYKSVELARELMRAGAGVRVVMSPSARRFVGEITFSTLTGNPVESELFPEPAPPEIPHTSLARWADLVVVAPATATTMAKQALGIADSALTALLLATTAPVLLAPAMHTEMWEAEATAGNVATLRRRGVAFVGPEAGELAGGDVGMGRLAEVASIVLAAEDVVRRRGELEGVRVVVSAGGTQEPIDPVRYIGNRSSGRMGYAIAAEALRRGAAVTLVSGPTHLEPPAGAELVRVTTAAEMREAVLGAAAGAAAVVMAAAVADWRPVTSAGRKLKKADGPPSVELTATGDILAELGAARRPGQVLAGFSAETEDVEARARRKLLAKSLDLVVGNLVGVGDSGFEVETNRAVVVHRSGRVDDLGLVTKAELARHVVDAVGALLGPRGAAAPDAPGSPPGSGELSQ
ncbi:MAG TPA: bifunctional phosphopantothenoylcysteine decarboxylase/phosphopantothenate--cysteine ligase CoaBC [Actinomycetota bacterium]